MKKLEKIIKDNNLTYKKDMKRSDGSIYTGYVDINKKAKGYGTVRYGDGARYEGEWHDGKPNGLGKLLLENGDTYEGEWKDD